MSKMSTYINPEALIDVNDAKRRGGGDPVTGNEGGRNRQGHIAEVK